MSKRDRILHSESWWNVTCRWFSAWHCGERATASCPEEVAQNVFTILARRAPGLRAGTGLSGWLHRTAVFQTSKAIRSETRHRRKIQALTDSMKQNHDRQGHAQMNEALPLLDEAIDQLSQRDRDVLLLRFFEGRSFKEIAPLINGTEASGQKRARRALTKLAAILKRKGVAVPAAALSAGLATNVALPHSAFPANGVLASTISQSALAGAPSISTKTVITNIFLNMSHTKTLAAIGLLVLVAIPLGAQRVEIASVRSSLTDAEAELRLLRQSASETERLAARTAVDKWQKESAARNDAGRLDPYVLADEVERAETGSMVAMVTLEKKLNSLDANEIVELHDATLQSDLSEAEQKKILPRLMEKLIKFDPDSATKMAMHLIGGRENNQYPMMFGMVRQGDG